MSNFPSGTDNIRTDVLDGTVEAGVHAPLHNQLADSINAVQSSLLAGVGVPAGGTTGQVLAKSSNTDYTTGWVTQTPGITIPLTQNLTFSPDNTYDIGASAGQRPRDLFLGRNFSVAGAISVGGQITAPNGSASNPAYSFANNTNLGLYRRAGNTLDITAFGRNLVEFQDQSSYRFMALGSDVPISWGATSDPGSGLPDTYLVRDAANTLAQRNGTNPQTLRLYGTYTDASNYNRGVLSLSQWPNYLYISDQAAGTGSSNGTIINGSTGVWFQVGGSSRWQIDTTHLFAVADNTYDIGASGANRPRNVYVGGGITVGGSVVAGTYVQATQLYFGTASLFAGTGAPAAGTGNNGDYYFRNDTPGTANQRIYVKSAGAWVGIV